MSAFDAGAPVPVGTGEARYFRFRGVATLTSPTQCIKFPGLPSVVTMTHLAGVSGEEPFLVEVGYADDFDVDTDDGRRVADEAAGPYRTQSPLVLDAATGEVFVRFNPQDTTPTVEVPLLVTYRAVFKEGHRG